jgi:hypothetical protein
MAEEHNEMIRFMEKMAVGSVERLDSSLLEVSAEELGGFQMT